MTFWVWVWVAVAVASLAAGAVDLALTCIVMSAVHERAEAILRAIREGKG